MNYLIFLFNISLWGEAFEFPKTTKSMIRNMSPIKSYELKRAISRKNMNYDEFEEVYDDLKEYYERLELEFHDDNLKERIAKQEDEKPFPKFSKINVTETTTEYRLPF